jgi:hypothetical protein
MRQLHIFLPAGETSPTLLVAAPELWLPEGARAAGPGAWTVTLRVGPLARKARVSIDGPTHRDAAVWRALQWQPVSEAGDPLPVDRLLPSFSGELGLVGSPQGSTLVLDGEYKVPLGPLGEVLDAVGLHRAARATGAALLSEILRASQRQLEMSDGA